MTKASNRSEVIKSRGQRMRSEDVLLNLWVGKLNCCVCKLNCRVQINLLNGVSLAKTGSNFCLRLDDDVIYYFVVVVLCVCVCVLSLIHI